MKKAFTFIELLLVIAILGILAALISGNFITSLKKGRDARRKADLNQIQKALEMYYEDNKAYPDNLDFSGTGQLCHPTGDCDTKIYMLKIPSDSSSACTYYYSAAADGSSYQLYSYLENNQDTGPGVNQGGYDPADCGTGCTCRFGVSSSNTLP